MTSLLLRDGLEIPSDFADTGTGLSPQVSHHRQGWSHPPQEKKELVLRVPTAIRSWSWLAAGEPVKDHIVARLPHRPGPVFEVSECCPPVDVVPSRTYRGGESVHDRSIDRVPVGMCARSDGNVGAIAVQSKRHVLFMARPR